MEAQPQQTTAPWKPSRSRASAAKQELAKENKENVSSNALPDASAETELPAVISVKKGRAGCAVVLLRDTAVIERCVLQRVAVVDGVCVELTRHVQKIKLDRVQEKEEGIFVAWGVKVERRMPVSAEGLEEYFNSLKGQRVPKRLVAKPPFEECHLSFPITSDASAPLSSDIRVIAPTKKEIVASGFCQEALILELRAAKDRLEELWERPPPPMARSLMTRVARSQLFPHSGEGGQEHENRAGDKLAEVVEITKLLEGIPPGAAFLDLCGGPGSWSQHFLEHKDLALRGFGFTLKSGAVGAEEDWQADTKDDWYPDLLAHKDWTALWGADGTGDLLKPGNLQHAAKRLAGEQVLLCVADGGFSDKAIPPNLLELYFYRLFLGELLMAASCLKKGGKFVCKLYTAFSAPTAALLFLTTRLFDKVEMTKPMSSRATGPERYLVASGFRDNDECATIVAALQLSHELGDGASCLVTPLLSPAVPIESMTQDSAFLASMTTMATSMCERQAKALNAVVDRAEYLEKMAMKSAVCGDPFSKTAMQRRDQIANGREQREKDQDTRWQRNTRSSNNWRMGGA